MLALQVKRLAPVVPEIRVSALGADAVVDGCIAAGTERGWQLVTASLPASTQKPLTYQA